MRLLSVAALSWSLWSCGSAPVRGDGMAGAASDTPAARGEPGVAAPTEAADETPQGFVAVRVLGVAPTPAGEAVLLGTTSESVMAIWIGPTEALSIRLRLERRRYQRPLTHDLLDSLVRELDGEIVKVHVDDLSRGTFVATVFLRGKGRVIGVDARPSDAIALALGNRVPIFVAQKVVEEAAVPFDKLREAVPDPEGLKPDGPDRTESL